MNIDTLLEAVKDGKMEINEAKAILARAPYEDLGFAKLDTHRAIRTGFAEVVYCQNKADDYLTEIFMRLYKNHGEVMGTRCSEKQYLLLKEHLPQLTYDPISRIAKIEKPKEKIGLIAVCTAGTADISIAEECAQTAEFFGQNVERFYDIGVSGLHRSLQSGAPAKGQLRGSGGRYGRRACLRHRRACCQSRHCRTDFCGLWCQFPRFIRFTHHD